MADPVATPAVPADPGAEPVEPTEPQEPIEPTTPVEPTEPVEPVEPQAPAYITADQMTEALDKQDSSFRSWLGRRDKDTLTHIGTVIDERFTSNQNQPSPEETSSRLLDNPRDVIRSEMDAYETERTTKNTMHINSTMETVGNLMETDPLYKNKDLGNEVVEEIKSLVNSGKVNTGVPAGEAGKIMLGEALSNVFRKRQEAKTNPLNQNTPQDAGGSLTPPNTPVKPKVKVPKLDDMTKKMADKWGYKDEDLAKLYGE